MTPITLIAAIFPVLVIVAAVKDVTSFTIPNWISLALLAAFAPAAWLSGIALVDVGLHVAVGVGFLVAGMIMFALNWIGGGDAKLFAVAGLWIGPSAVGGYLLGTALAGGVLAILLMTLRNDVVRTYVPAGPRWVEELRNPKGAAPYGVAIATGALFAFPSSILALGLLGG